MGFFGNDNKGFFDRLKDGLSKTRKFLLKNVDDVILGEKKISPELFEELEEVLIAADVGPAFTYELIERMKDEVKRKDLSKADLLRQVLKDTMGDILKKSEAPLLIPKDKLFVMMVVGVNGTGKTTTIGKLAMRFKSKGMPVMIAAADTFRAAAIEQLEVWGQRTGTEIIRQATGADPSAVIFDALQAAKARKASVLLVDTAGRLHTKANLMTELEKMRRTATRVVPGAPHEVWLVLDATTGQNGLEQARKFTESAGVTGLVLTKLDGTAKGGIVVAITRELNVPIRYIGVGEQAEDLLPFEPEKFIASLFES